MSYMKVIRLGSLCITSSGYKEAEDQNCGSWLWISNVNPAHPLAIPALIVKMRQQTSGVKQTKKQESSSCFQTLLHPEAFSSSRPFKAQEDVNCQGSLGIYCTVRQERRSKETTHGREDELCTSAVWEEVFVVSAVILHIHRFSRRC